MRCLPKEWGGVATPQKDNVVHSRITIAILAPLCFCGCDEDKMILELKDVH